MQFQMLHRHGVYIGKRKDENQVIVLFQLNGFYVEVYYRQYRRTIDRIITSESTDILQPYLEQIQLNGFN